MIFTRYCGTTATTTTSTTSQFIFLGAIHEFLCSIADDYKGPIVYHTVMALRLLCAFETLSHHAYIYQLYMVSYSLLICNENENKSASISQHNREKLSGTLKVICFFEWPSYHQNIILTVTLIVIISKMKWRTLKRSQRPNRKIVKVLALAK